ncbi:hypothetical protein AQJ43_23740 [Streptomyces avermitilis]|uniref:Head-to-tail adaptor n=2 Tax=Streptomyces avermitilis TaxID=33903 RepID=Q82C38_STRAW|nr:MULTISPECIES: hypothetical protein [Streptomyces]KUN52240.1 hypothetical protein AQJ43_23740 [Streptomyces avermitilis]MYT01097.1 hypothetical protein [Streptomyces sp. SID5469]OOV30712.1 hypothetical protein SM007_16030 [Streptomyces avermitilis]BAC73228.1 hypothetical protein SAVERM_5516 [Streptomyces avermitilis MA-4680 = NBRC 14893]BBJ53671.1 hypothetical protein SAVMC3_63000 [Streptomyces avermitilis]
MAYATVEEFTDYLDPDPVPANASRLLDRASTKLDRLLTGAVYETNADGLPTDPALAAVFREAVCIQAQYIGALGDETGANANVASMTLGNQSIVRALGGRDGKGTTPRVSQDLLDLLQVKGLLPVFPRVWG